MHNLDLNLDLRIRLEKIFHGMQQYLAGLYVAYSAVINEMFAEDINDLTNFQHRVLGTISEPKLERVKIRNKVARPRKEKKPITSVTVVTTTLPAIAGS